MNTVQSELENQISIFLSATPRYKFVIATWKCVPAGFIVFDLGYHLAVFLKEKDKATREELSFVVQDELTRLFYQNINEHSLFGKYIILSNVGILFEKELDINIMHTFQRLSRNTLVILLWEGVIKNNTLFFLSEKSKYKIDLLEINHIILS